MPLRQDIAYAIIALMLIAGVIGLLRYRRARANHRRLMRGGRPRTR